MKHPDFIDEQNDYQWMTADRHGQTETGQEIPVGTRARYRGHLPGCAVSVELEDGTRHVVHPAIFAELR